MVEKSTNTGVERALSGAADELVQEFRGVFSPETVQRYLQESYDSLPHGRVAIYRPIFAVRFARERLRAVAQAAGTVSKDRPEVLFVCVHNAGRSQIAAALTTKLSNGVVSVRSAGSIPANELNAAVVQAMADLGIDISQEFAKPLTDDVVQAADVVITMGCGDSCPVYPGKRYLDWVVDDPAGLSVEDVRPIIDDIERRVKELLEELGVGPREVSG